MVHVIINGFAGHDEVRAEERRQDGNQLPGESPPYSSDLPLKELDDIVDHFRSHQLAVETKLLETLTTGDFLVMSRLSLTFYLSNEMKALGTSLDLMKVKERKDMDSAVILCFQLPPLNTLVPRKLEKKNFHLPGHRCVPLMCSQPTSTALAPHTAQHQALIPR